MENLRPGDPTQVGDYRLLQRLGAGGMGQVFLGRSQRGRTVAVKLVHAQLAYDAEFRRRFRAEVAAARRVGGEWTAPVLDADTEADTPWVATGYVAGPTLHQAVTEICGPLPEQSVWHLASGLARALQSIHGCGLVHRDLKPSNVMLTVNGPRVIDFGVARAADASVLTRTGAMVGSPGYMSPEQILGSEITGLSDVFSLGLVLAFAATGRQAFGGPDSGVHAIMLRVTEGDPDLEGMPEPLAEFVGRCLAKRPEDRIPLPEIVATAEAATADAHSDTWLPGALTAELGRHASSLLDLEAPPPTQVDNPAAGRGGENVHALPTMQDGRVPLPPPGTPTPVPMPPVPTPTPTPMPPMPTPRMTVTTPPMPPVPGGFQPGGRRRSRVGPVLLTVAAVAVLAIVLAVTLPGLKGNENRANPGASGATSSSKSPKASPADYEGNWTGNVREADSGLYSVKVNYTGGKLGDQVATVEYPSLACSGRWILTMDTGHSVQVREEITEESSPSNCVDQVDIVLTPSGDGSLRYEVTSVEDTGTLQRSK
ncbi:serine/threonine-protein kinase [Streptomyces fulvoviolaceus]|uniref:serine/threonine-protein kinase n=1 Tax=Streptomyces fulvoviolaceus TaxID=285535 RepID=UPI0004CC402F|nr:serine/threonine-protein kinase [Streptomyces fulvoviolaceus]MCT9079199.1 serine/threonine protein kinase [Streptomyces fulvoviolaceus]